MDERSLPRAEIERSAELLLYSFNAGVFFSAAAPQPSLLFLPSLSSVPLMDYDAYDALLHHIFKRVRILSDPCHTLMLT